MLPPLQIRPKAKESPPTYRSTFSNTDSSSTNQEIPGMNLSLARLIDRISRQINADRATPAAPQSTTQATAAPSGMAPLVPDSISAPATGGQNIVDPRTVMAPSPAPYSWTPPTLDPNIDYNASPYRGWNGVSPLSPEDIAKRQKWIETQYAIDNPPPRPDPNVDQWLAAENARRVQAGLPNYMLENPNYRPGQTPESERQLSQASSYGRQDPRNSLPPGTMIMGDTRNPDGSILKREDNPEWLAANPDSIEAENKRNNATYSPAQQSYAELQKNPLLQQQNDLYAGKPYNPVVTPGQPWQGGTLDYTQGGPPVYTPQPKPQAQQQALGSPPEPARPTSQFPTLSPGVSPTFNESSRQASAPLASAPAPTFNESGILGERRYAGGSRTFDESAGGGPPIPYQQWQSTPPEKPAGLASASMQAAPMFQPGTITDQRNPNYGLTPLTGGFSGNSKPQSQTSLPSFQPQQLPGEPMPGGVKQDSGVSGEVRRQLRGMNFSGMNAPMRFTT